MLTFKEDKKSNKKLIFNQEIDRLPFNVRTQIQNALKSTCSYKFLTNGNGYLSRTKKNFNHTMNAFIQPSKTEAKPKNLIEKLIHFNRKYEENMENFKHLKEENTHFQQKYEISKRKNEEENKKKIRTGLITTSNTFSELISNYNKKGYKIPDLSVKKNLFEPSTLLMEDNKIQDYYKIKSFREKKKIKVEKEKDIFLMQTMLNTCNEKSMSKFKDENIRSTYGRKDTLIRKPKEEIQRELNEMKKENRKLNHENNNIKQLILSNTIGEEDGDLLYYDSKNKFQHRFSSTTRFSGFRRKNKDLLSERGTEESNYLATSSTNVDTANLLSRRTNDSNYNIHLANNTCNININKPQQDPSFSKERKKSVINLKTKSSTRLFQEFQQNKQQNNTIVSNSSFQSFEKTEVVTNLQQSKSKMNLKLQSGKLQKKTSLKSNKSRKNLEILAMHTTQQSTKHLQFDPNLNHNTVSFYSPQEHIINLTKEKRKLRDLEYIYNKINNKDYWNVKEEIIEYFVEYYHKDRNSLEFFKYF
jgi:hypothetical protein